MSHAFHQEMTEAWRSKQYRQLSSFAVIKEDVQQLDISNMRKRACHLEDNNNNIYMNLDYLGYFCMMAFITAFH
jgi:hypothetical protein